MLYNREEALAWDFSEIGRVKEEVAPPQKIRTVPHEAWQVANFSTPRALLPVVIEMLKERMRVGIYEYCSGPYRNPWFLVKKQSAGKYRLVNAAVEINKRSIRDTNLPLSLNKFAEYFAGCQIASLVDFYSKYN